MTDYSKIDDALLAQFGDRMRLVYTIPLYTKLFNRVFEGKIVDESNNDLPPAINMYMATKAIGVDNSKTATITYFKKPEHTHYIALEGELPLYKVLSLSFNSNDKELYMGLEGRVDPEIVTNTNNLDLGRLQEMKNGPGGSNVSQKDVTKADAEQLAKERKAREEVEKQAQEKLDKINKAKELEEQKRLLEAQNARAAQEKKEMELLQQQDRDTAKQKQALIDKEKAETERLAHETLQLEEERRKKANNNNNSPGKTLQPPLVVNKAKPKDVDNYNQNPSFGSLYRLVKLLSAADASVVTFENWAIHKLLNTFNVAHCLPFHFEVGKSILPIFLKPDPLSFLAYRLVAVRLRNNKKGVEFVLGRYVGDDAKVIFKTLKEMEAIVEMEQGIKNLPPVYGTMMSGKYVDFTDTYPMIGVVYWSWETSGFGRRDTCASSTELTLTADKFKVEYGYFPDFTDQDAFDSSPKLGSMDEKERKMLLEFYFGGKHIETMNKVLLKNDHSWYHAFDAPYLQIELWDSLIAHIPKLSILRDLLPQSAVVRERTGAAHQSERDTLQESASSCLANLDRVNEKIGELNSQVVSLKSDKSVLEDQVSEQEATVLKLENYASRILDVLLRESDSLSETAVDELIVLVDQVPKSTGGGVTTQQSLFVDSTVMNMDMMHEMSDFREKLRSSILKGPYSMNVCISECGGERIAAATKLPAVDFTVRHVNTIMLNNKALCGTTLNSNVTKSYASTMGLQKKSIIPTRGSLSLQVRHQESGKVIGTREIAYNIEANEKSLYYALKSNNLCLYTKFVDRDHVDLKMLLVDVM